MNWKYEFIDIVLMLTLNDDILILTLNDLILTSTILVMLVHHVSSRRRTIAKYMPVSLYIRAHQNAQETLMKFWFTSMNLSFLTDLLGYMVIQIICKQLLTHYTDIKRKLQGDKHEYDSRAYAPLKIINILNIITVCDMNSMQVLKHHLHKNLFRLTWKKSRFLYAGFYCVV
jgi:hypothetical protein